MGFYFVNFIFVGLVLLPNLSVLLVKPVNLIEYKHKVFEGFERIGQLGVFILPMFYKVDMNLFKYTIYLLMVFLIIYYIGWIRFLYKGHQGYLLFYPLFKMPIPLAVSPCIYFGILSLTLNSWLLFIFVTIFSIGHIPMSYLIYKKYVDLNQ